MQKEVTCYFCYETFKIYLDLIDGSDTVIIDCGVCCNPNLISYQIRNKIISIFNVNSGND